MRLTTKGRHALTAMMHLAQHAGRGAVTLADISHAQGVSLSYLEQLFARLRRHGLVRGVRGPGGGYRLAASPSTISVAKIIDAIDDRTPAERTRLFASYRPGTRGAAQDMWNEFSRSLYDYLDNMTLDRFMAEDQDSRGAAMGYHARAARNEFTREESRAG
ncbi:MAG: Rrf2 family transcriptional regulator [Halothiobacillaceae bacterium]|jgi:Rrf2 family iron-sulfur cluster assembly transcriptional regulator|nr:Rrf2 family transcriptional regulator [Halothiobacillaceae bacterium]